jgi:leishmanolysin-like peptidase
MKHLLLLLSTITTVMVESHKCIHDHVKDIINNPPKYSTKPDLYSNLEFVEGTKRRNLKSVSWKPLRIGVVYKLDNSPLTAANKTFLRKVLLPKAVSYWHNALSVRRPEKLLVEGTCTHVFESPHSNVCAKVAPATENYCADIKISASLIARHAYYSQPGQPAQYTPAVDGSGTSLHDYILYVTADDTKHCGSSSGDTVLAYASMCRRDSNDRPVMGYANFCPTEIDASPNKYKQQYKTAKHEIAHALGFTDDSWSRMRNEDGSRRTTVQNKQLYTCADNSKQEIIAPSSSTIARETKRGKNVHLVVTERVKKVAQAYYNCSSTNGAELEDQVGGGCLGSHWEERTMFDELMSPLADHHYAGNRVSKFTLALFEDTGWYKANYSFAEPLKFGKNAGCDFLNKKCVDPSTGKALSVPKSTFCSSINDPNSCIFDFRAYGQCSM